VELNNPRPAGHYQDSEGRHWLHQVHNGTAYGAPDRDVDQWLNPHGKIANPPEHLEQLYTRDQALTLITGAQYVVPEGTILVTDFAAHAVMVDTREPNAAAVPAVQLHINGTIVGTSTDTSVLLLMEDRGAREISDSISARLSRLDALRRSQDNA